MSHQPSPLFDALDKSLSADQFIRLTLSKIRKGVEGAQRVTIRLVDIKEQAHLCFVYKYETKDITKNYLLDEARLLIADLLANTYLIANLFTTEKQIIVEIRKKGKVTVRTQAGKATDTPPARQHDRQKKEWVTDKRFLLELGILNNSGNVKKDKGDKYRQIKKFVEIVDGLVRQTPALTDKKPLRIVDMGAGKGYLTFALYDYFVHTTHRSVKMTGVEIRESLIVAGNDVAEKLGYKDLNYEAGFIQDYGLPETDILLALHACDTATDDAIYKGIEAQAELIICAPCCHKQIRRAITKSDNLQPILNHGILIERQAEIITDTIRALLLESKGYKAKVFEFISTEHTGKNLMIVGQKHDRPVKEEEWLTKVAEIKQQFGIKAPHYLETLFTQKK